MGFSNQEKINLTTKALAAGVIDANSIGQWYESLFLNGYTVAGRRVWTQMANIEANPAPNLATAQSNAAGALSGIIQDLSAAANAKRLTTLPGTNNSTWVAYNTYGDLSSGVLDNWVQPQQSPQSTGLPSIGYAIRLFDGDPNVAGVEISTTAGTTGVGVNKTVGWFWHYSLGMLLLSADFFTETGINPATFDPYVNGFPYIGTNANSSAPTHVIREDITAGGGVKNGVNPTFPLLNTVIVSGSEQVFLNGMLLSPTTAVAPVDYTFSAGPATITFNAARIPTTTDDVFVSYLIP